MMILTRKAQESLSTYGYVQAFIVGQQGSGKTTCSLHSATEIYGDWETALEHLFFDPIRAISRIREEYLERGRRQIPMVIFDDAGLHFSKYLWYQDPYFVQLVNSFFNIIRTRVACCVFTSPDLDVLVELRKKSWIVGDCIDLDRSDGESQVDWIYKYTRRGRLKERHLGTDRFPLYIPNDIRKEYEERREAAIEDLEEKLEQHMAGLDRAKPPVSVRKFIRILRKHGIRFDTGKAVEAYREIFRIRRGGGDVQVDTGGYKASGQPPRVALSTQERD